MSFPEHHQPVTLEPALPPLSAAWLYPPWHGSSVKQQPQALKYVPGQSLVLLEAQVLSVEQQSTTCPYRGFGNLLEANEKLNSLDFHFFLLFPTLVSPITFLSSPYPA